jgi:carbonic anhydrase
MRLFEAIVDANHRALAGDANAGLRQADFAGELPVAALTCIDARLNTLFPEVLGLAKEHFIWLRNAGNIITGPLSSTMRSLALACAVKGAKEIAVIGHTDCLVCKTSMMKLTESFRALGVDRSQLPENLTEYFGLFASERQNVIKAADFIRRSPLIGPRIPVHGLLVDISTGQLEWMVNGYQVLESATVQPMTPGAALVEQGMDSLKALGDFKIGDLKMPQMKIGDLAGEGKNWLAQEVERLGAAVSDISKSSQPASPPPLPPPPPGSPAPPGIPVPPRLRPSIKVARWKRG